MRRIFGLLLLLFTCNISAQTVLSKIPKTGKTIQAFVPAGYDTISTATGDLNKDGLADYLLVLRPGEERSRFDKGKQKVNPLIKLSYFSIENDNE